MSAPTPPARRYAFLRTPRWIGLIALMVAVAVACVFLGRWQWHRYESRHADSRQIGAVYDAAPVPLEDVLTGTGVPPGHEWRPVTMTGRYVDGGTVVLRNRPAEGQAAGHLVAPFVARLGDGREVVVVVDRGWLPADEVEEPGSALPQPPSGQVTVTGRLRAPEAPVDRKRPHGQIYTLTPPQVLAAAAQVTDVSAAAGLPVMDGYVLGAAERPPAAVALGTYSRPSLNWGLNLSYTIQWGLFAAAALGAIVILARREAAERAGMGPVRRVTRDDLEEDLEVSEQLRRAARGLPAAPRREGGSGRPELLVMPEPAALPPADDAGRAPGAQD
ncbi:SURF1 family cytochrome oxidase biogenesis protein [Georgenia ruanii]|uniref:SURF1 family cytochrome oxidase biogenesis protein n=1 Tax=Georgenia ruanii TaxID=348442 RepID=UPI0012655143|nr:SURF1 family protein [Georgenia ruanii]